MTKFSSLIFLIILIESLIHCSWSPESQLISWKKKVMSQKMDESLVSADSCEAAVYF